jgi:tellurite methyltransferase
VLLSVSTGTCRANQSLTLFANRHSALRQLSLRHTKPGRWPVPLVVRGARGVDLHHMRSGPGHEPADVDAGMTERELHREFGDIDIYLFDQLQRGRIIRGMRILDAGCGAGRNLIYLIKAGFDVWAVDQDPVAIETLRSRLSPQAPHFLAERFHAASVEQLPFADGQFDFLISSAVLHFARDEEHWAAMVNDMWRVLAPGGTLFARLASTVGHESRVKALGGRRYIRSRNAVHDYVGHQQTRLIHRRGLAG